MAYSSCDIEVVLDLIVHSIYELYRKLHKMFSPICKHIYIYIYLIINKKNKEIKFPKSIEIFKVIIIFLITGEYSMVNISWPIVTGKFIYSTDN